MLAEHHGKADAYFPARFDDSSDALNTYQDESHIDGSGKLAQRSYALKRADL